MISSPPVRAAPAAAVSLLTSAVMIPMCAVAAFAADANVTIGARKLLVLTSAGPAEQKLRFRAIDEPSIEAAHDPRAVNTWLLVQGLGPDAGSTGRIDLDPASWRLVGALPVPPVFKYRDLAGARAGIRKVVLEAGRLVVRGGGAAWPWQPAGAQDEVWVFFGIEEETWCARFGGRIRRNQAGEFRARRAPAPQSCPVSVCGNRELEPGEECDDGNLDDADGCTAACALGACDREPFDSTWEAIEQRVFVENGCTNLLCHGAPPGEGDLYLSPGAAYTSLVGVAATGSAHDRVEPGSPSASALYLKLLKAADESVDIPGDPMPPDLPAIDADLIEALRLWILAGAPETGTVAGTEILLDGCFPPPQAPAATTSFTTMP